MPDLVASDILLKQTCLNLQGLLAGSWLRLYYNNLPPSPENLQSNFSECYFGGYDPAPIASFTGPLKQQAGEWTLNSPNCIFKCTVLPSQLVYGWYLTTPLGVLLSAPFAAPVNMFPGALLSVQLLVTDWATFTLVG
jgi:hypothetical protein